MKALFDGKEAYNISFDGKSAEHLMLDGTLVWSRSNLFFTQSLTLLNVSKLKENDIAVVDSQQNGEKFRAERISSEESFSPAELADGYYLILGE